LANTSVSAWVVGTVPRTKRANHPHLHVFPHGAPGRLAGGRQRQGCDR
jgi:hypothetical protein